MEYLIKIIQEIAPIAILFGKMVFDNKRKKNNEIERQKKENEAQILRDKKQDEIEINNKNQIELIKNSIISTSDRLTKIEKLSNYVKTIMDLRVFEKSFIRDFKRTNRKVVDKLTENQELKAFLKGGISEVAVVFQVIIESQFTISDAEIEAEFSEAKISLSSKFKHKNPEYGKFVNIVQSEILKFIEFYQDVKVKENGERMDSFNSLCKKTIINIITEIAK